jgi:hypothetical protein
LNSKGHHHNHEDEGKSIKEKKQKDLSYNSLMLFLNENHPRKIVKDEMKILSIDEEAEAEKETKTQKTDK